MLLILEDTTVIVRGNNKKRVRRDIELFYG